jgi:hypothetical protein
MNDRSVGWIGTLSERVLKNPAVEFLAFELAVEPDLFAHRAALFYTPTSSLPGEYVGTGPLDITLPIVTADYTESIEFRAPKSLRFWVDLIQRQTMKIRWQPIPKARVQITRHDYYKIRDDHFIAGIKALLDAFKERTSGRPDGGCIYYFGSIVDDGATFVQLESRQFFVDHPFKAHTRLQIEPC